MNKDWADKVRSQKYLQNVREHGCLICHRPPQAHHLTHAQGLRGMRRTGDQWAVPLCQEHHFNLHAYGNESQWWALQGIDPIKWAENNWKIFNDEKG
tara:strand:+ start:15637 stop:15927 length:291 start_codon:yes stop_codon:yes gene_type:complete